MKNLYFVVFIFILSTELSQAQNPFTAGVTYGANKAKLIDSRPMPCGPTVYAKEYYQEIGVSVSKPLGRKWEIQSGLVYGSGEVLVNANIGEGVEPRSIDNIKVLSIPIQFKFYPLSFLFISAGPVLDLSENNSLFDQSGIGFKGGIGGQYQTGRIRFTLMPQLRMHRVIPFENLASNGSVALSGIELGMAYQLGSK